MVVLSELGMIGPGMVGPNPVPVFHRRGHDKRGEVCPIATVSRRAETLSFKFQKAPKNPTKRAREKVRGKKTKRQAV